MYIMATKTFKTRIQLKYDTYVNWFNNNPTPLAGELCVVVVPAETGAVVQEPAILYKVGDGSKDFKALPFVSAKAADVYDWAKAAVKPEYSADEIKNLSDYISGEIQDTNTTYKIEVDANNPRKFTLFAKELNGSFVEQDTITLPEETVYSLVEGETNGTVKFNNVEVKVHGLDSAAYMKASDFDAAGAASTALDSAKTYADGKDTAIAEAKAAAVSAQSDVDALKSKVGEIPEGATAATVVGYVDEKFAAVPAQTDYSVTVTSSTPDGVAKRYNIKQPSTNLDVNIDIPKDMVVESGTVETKADAGVWGEAGTYLHLVLANAAEDDIYINVSSLIEYVTSGSAADDMVVVSVSDDHKVSAVITDGTITLEKLHTDVQTAIGKAHEHANKTELDKIADGDKAKWDAAEAKAHEHENKAVLDGISAEKVSAWDNKANDADLAAIAKSGNVNDLAQTEGDYIIFNCGTSSTVI